MTQLPAQLVALALLIGGAFFAGRCSVAPPPPDPALARAIDSLEARIDSLEPIAARKDSVAVVTEDRWRTVTKEVRELVPAGLPVPWPVFLRVLETGDTALASCTAARVSCQELRQAEAARGDSLERDRDLWRARARGRLLELAGEGSTDFDGVYVAADAEVRLDGEWRGFGRLEQRLDSAGRSLRFGIRRHF
jgi:hypothetical protein